MNPPFHQHDGVDGQGPTAFFRTAIGEQKLSKTSVLLLPVQSYVNLLVEASAKAVVVSSSAYANWRAKFSATVFSFESAARDPVPPSDLRTAPFVSHRQCGRVSSSFRRSRLPLPGA